MPASRRILAAFAAGGIFLLAGCSGQSGPLMPQTVNGQLDIAGGMSLVTPGEPADTTAFVVNSAASPVILLSASLVPVPGFPVGHLSHVAVIVGKDIIGGGRGWPPGVRTRPLRGAVLGHGVSFIAVAMSGPAAGRSYEAAGLKIVYLFQGSIHSMMAWVVIGACVVHDIQHSSPDSCSAVTQRAFDKVSRQAG